MLRKRIIPCLDIKEAKVVKGVHFQGLVKVGDPVEFAKHYELQGADEIVFLDIAPSVEKKETIHEVIQRGASKLSVPLTVGGGIHTLEEVRLRLRLGADKVSINSVAVENPKLIETIAKEFGSQCVVVAIDGKRDETGKIQVWINGGTKNTGLDLVKWAKTCEKLGAGELLITSMDADGTQKGYDIDMIKLVVDQVNIPVIASGGCGEIQDIVHLFEKTNCDAALVASMLHYGKVTIEEIKERLQQRQISVRRGK